jgi:uncharacterized protein (TIGR02145 family)
VKQLIFLTIISIATGTAVAQAPVDLSVCYGKGYTLTSVANASGTSPVTYQWYENSVPIGSSTPELTIPTGRAVGSYTYVRVALNAACTLSSNTYTVQVKPNPTISRISGDASQTVTQGTGISTNIFTATNATGISWSGSLPTGVSGTVTANAATYTISGTPSTASTTGTYSYTVTASNTNGCPSASISGTITVMAGPPRYAASTNTWTVGTQTWSDVIKVPACDKSTYTAGYTTADCRNNGSYGYLYSWMYVNNNASTLCPSPWRVPMSDDFCTLDKTLFSTSTCAERSAPTDYATYNSSLWGGSFGGFCYDNGSPNSQGTIAYYWSSTEVSSNSARAYHLMYYSGRIRPQADTQKNYGYLVRCVKD